MNTRYPVVEERALDPVPPKKYPWHKRTRTKAEIPAEHSNHRLVYTVDDDYVLDNGGLSLDSDLLLDATQVTMVDVSRDVEVLVQFEIASKDFDKFTLRTTFSCTVTDPIAVVRNGAQDVQRALTTYLKGHPRLAELGIDYELAQINDVRRKIRAQVTAYTTVTPPVYLGLVANLASVEVLTPPELAAFQRSRRDQAGQHIIEYDLQRKKHVLRSNATENDHEIESLNQQHELTLDADKREFNRYQHRKDADVTSDPMDAMRFAYANGDISAKEFADEYLKYEDSRSRYKREEAAREREWEQESVRSRWESERLDKDRAWQSKQRQIEHDQAEQNQKRIWDREDQAQDRAEKQRKLDAQIVIIRDMAQRGHLDTVNLNLEKFVSAMLADAPEQDQKSIEEIDALYDRTTLSPENGEFDDVEVREEDDQ